MGKEAGEQARQPIAVSLRTREPATARMIAARLTLRSEQILSQESSNMLSKQQAKSLLTAAVSDHLHKLNRLAAMELAEGIDADDGRRLDLITGWALRLKAARGDRAVVQASDHAAILDSGLQTADFTLIDKTIASLRQQHRTAPRAKILHMLEDCGASQTPGDVAQAEALLYRGQAAALLAVDHRWSGQYEEDDQLVEHVLAKEAHDVVPLETKNVELMPMRAEGAPQSLGEQVDAATTPTPAQPVAATGPTSVLELAERLIKEKAKLKEWRQKTQNQVRAVAQLFVKMLGADDVARVSQARIADYRTLLLTLPTTYGKNSKDFDRPLEELLEHAKALPPDKVGRQGTTLNRHLTQLKSIIEYIESSGFDIGDYKGVHRLRARTEMRARDARAPFSPSDLRGFFAQPPWTGCRSERSRFEPGSVIIHDSLYWVPLLAKATLARREELCGLDVEDVITTGGIEFINLKFNDHRSLKNQQSIRHIPLTREILRLGFLEYREAIKNLGYKLLFPELEAASDRTPFGDVFHGDWIKIQAAVLQNADNQRKSFHSFRKTSAQELKDADVVSELRADILGHGGANITEERYVSSAKLTQVLGALNKLPDYTSHLERHEIRLRKNVLTHKPRASARPRRRPQEDLPEPPSK
uniref:Phage integrase family protein n=1 Tax=Rhodopseudomonas palustris (strain BisA53) TaxID=316055 RepID=Q07SQ5_RHOP5